MPSILIVTDTTHSCAATERGLHLASCLGLDAELVNFVFTPLQALRVPAAERTAIRKRLLARRKEETRALANRHARPGQKVKVRVLWREDTVDWLIRQGASGRYAGIVKSRGGQGSLVQASSDWRLLRECEVPVMLVADEKWRRTRRILVAIDLATSRRDKQNLNDKLLRSGKLLAAALGVELKIISVIEVPVLLADLDLIDPVAHVAQEEAKLRPRIAQLAREHDIPEKAFFCKQGPVDKVITSYAARVKAQLVVMGTVARRGPKAWLLGNTAEKVLQHLKTDVLALKP